MHIPNGFEEAVIGSILKENLKALVYLHQKSHIHRDVKVTANVLEILLWGLHVGGSYFLINNELVIYGGKLGMNSQIMVSLFVGIDTLSSKMTPSNYKVFIIFVAYEYGAISLFL